MRTDEQEDVLDVIRYAACASGPCDQGRRLCPSPDACRLSEQRRKETPTTGSYLIAAVLIVLLLAAVIFGVER